VSLAIPSLQLRLTTSLFSNLDFKLETRFVEKIMTYCIVVPLSAYFTTIFTSYFPVTVPGFILVSGVSKTAVT
jgi:hypothetical protein